MASQPSVWAGVGAGNVASNHPRVAGENRSSTLSGYDEGATETVTTAAGLV
jgi:hypothetical protein